MILADIFPDVLNRLEEAQPSGNPSGPVFWNLVGEVYPQIVNAMYEACLLTGIVQVVSQPYTITASTTYFKNPIGMIAPLRLRAPYNIRKGTLKGLDDMVPSWQRATPGKQLQSWFPLGCSGFGVYPQLASEASVVIDWIASPVNVPRPYDGTLPVPFEEQFVDGLSQYGAAACRMKEGGAEADEASAVFNEYMSAMRQLSLWQARLDSLNLSAVYGGQVQTNSRSVA